MRTILFLATLTVAAAAALAQQPAAAPEEKVGEAPTVPTGETAAEAAAPVAESGVIARINVQGNRRVETDAIRASLPLKVGDAFDREKLKNALLAVWRMGYFNEVKLDVNEELSKDDLKDTIEVRPFQILDQEAVRKSAKKIQEKYVEKGFFLAEVTTKIVPLPNNEVNVVFSINEHAKITVKEVRFVGNRAIATPALKDAMLTQEGSPFSFLTGAGTFREDAFQRDEIVLQGLYFDQGYIFVKFGKPAIELSPDKRYIFITMSIEEGDPFDVGKIDVGGDLLVPREQLLALVSTRSGERFSKTRLQNDMNRLLDVYKDKGYAYANVTPDTQVEAEKRIVDLTYVFQKGQPVTIEKIEIVGNNKTRDKVLRREMKIAEGDLYNGTGVRNSKARITALGFFDSVEINQKRGTTDDKMLLEVSVKEKLTGTFQIGFGFAGGENFFGQAQLAQNNLLGYGHTASLSLQISSIRQLFQLSYLDPYVL